MWCVDHVAWRPCSGIRSPEPGRGWGEDAAAQLSSMPGALLGFSRAGGTASGVAGCSEDAASQLTGLSPILMRLCM